MTIESAIDQADLRRWAIRTLGFVHPREDLDAAAILRFLTKSEYVLSADAADAVGILAQGAGIADAQMRSAREQRLTTSVGEFAGKFFEIAPHKRASRWEKLSEQCGKFPALVEWLDDLSSGLAYTDLPFAGNERVNNFVNACRDVFVARPADRIRRRQEFMAKCRERPVVWEPIAREVIAYHSAFVEQIAPWVEEIPRSGLPRPQATVAAQDGRSSHFENETSIRSSKPWWLIFAVAMFLLRFLRFEAATGERLTQTPGQASSPKAQFDSPSASAVKVPSRRTQNVDAILNDAIQSRAVPASSDRSGFSFDAIPPEIVERMCGEAPGLRESITDPETRRDIESFMTRLMPEVNDEIRLRYRESHGRPRMSSKEVKWSIDPDVTSAKGLERAAPLPLWLSQLRAIAAFTSKAGSNPVKTEDPAVSALMPENDPELP